MLKISFDALKKEENELKSFFCTVCGGTSTPLTITRKKQVALEKFTCSFGVFIVEYIDAFEEVPSCCGSISVGCVLSAEEQKKIVGRALENDFDGIGSSGCDCIEICDSLSIVFGPNDEILIEEMSSGWL